MSRTPHAFAPLRTETSCDHIGPTEYVPCGLPESHWVHAGPAAGLRRVGRIIVDDRPHCHACGHLVHVQPGPDGQEFREPDETDTEAALKERGWQDEYEVATAAAMNHGNGAAEARQQGPDRADELREIARELLPLAYAWVDYRKGGDAADRFEARMLAALRGPQVRGGG